MEQKKTYSNEKTVVTEPYKVRTNEEYRFVVVGANGRQSNRNSKNNK